jgi:putative hydrolase of the HAD superfamily
MLAARRALIRPKAVLFDLFHTLAYVPVPESVGERAVPDILGISSEEFHRLYYDEDVFGRAVGRVRDSVEAMRLVAHAIDPTVDEDRILAAVESRRRRFEMGLVNVEAGVLDALDRLRALGIRTAIVSDAAVDDLESWPNSPLRSRIDAAIFSYEVGVRKPDRRIYEHALRAIDARSDESLFVGDGGSDEHNGARAVGMGAVLVTRMYGLYRPEGIPERRAHADWEFEDVPAFVAALPT